MRQRFDQRPVSADTVVASSLGIIEIRESCSCMPVDVTGGFTGLHHVAVIIGGKNGLAAMISGDLAALADVLGDLRAGVLDPAPCRLAEATISRVRRMGTPDA